MTEFQLKPQGRSKRIFELLKLICCDCGLTHDMAFAIEKSGSLGVAMRRNNRSTVQRRRKILRIMERSEKVRKRGKK